MKAFHTPHLNTGGSALITVIIHLCIGIGVVLTVLDMANNHSRISANQIALEQSIYMAEAGLERGARYVESNIVALSAANGTLTTVSGSIGSGINSGNYTFVVTRVNNNLYSLICTGSVRTSKRVVSIQRIYQPSFAELALWSHINGAIYYAYGDIFTGHVHSDDVIYFDATSGGPIFSNLVTSATNTYVVANGALSDIYFGQGFSYPTSFGTMSNVDFNSSATNSLKTIATNSGLVLNGNSTLSFNGSTVQITNPTLGWTNHVYTPPNEGIIYVANHGSTSGTNAGTVILNGGTISGRLTVVAENNMTIQSNIMYATDPRTHPNATNALGLISQDNISVGTSAPNNLEVDAAIMATGTSGDGSAGSWGVISYNTGSPRGNLTVYGGIVQYQRGAVGTLNSGGTIASGYKKNYSYDPRFLNTPPPYYPVVQNVVRFANWQDGPRQ